MAINPNTDFTAGAILTADQQNRFPRGIMALSTLTSNVTLLNAETSITNVSFTAVANRNYRINYFCGNASNVGASLNTFVFRQTSVAGTILATNLFTNATAFTFFVNFSCITTFAAGSQSIFVRGSTNGGAGTILASSATSPSFLVVEDIGPA
jgi:hypothetical protein